MIGLRAGFASLKKMRIWASDHLGWAANPGLILFVLMALACAHFWLHKDFTIDDAAISFSYARTLAQGFGLGELYPGAFRVEGYSNFTWVMLLALGTRLGFQTIFVAKALGLTFLLGATLLLERILRRLLHFRWVTWALIAFPFSLAYVFWSASGLENSLYGFLILLAVWFLLQEDECEPYLPIGSALTLVLVALTRPEGFVYVLAGLGYKAIQILLSWRAKTRDARWMSLRALAVWSSVFGLGFGGYMIWHYAYFAFPLPNPAYAKTAIAWRELASRVLHLYQQSYIVNYFLDHRAIYLVPGVLLGALAAVRSRARVLTIFAVAALALPVYADDWMVNYRFFFVFIPFEILLATLSIDYLLSVYSHRPRARTPWPWLSLGLAAITALGIGRYALGNFKVSIRYASCGYRTEGPKSCSPGYWEMGDVEALYEDTIQTAHQVGLQDPIYLVPDIGATTYVRNMRVLDLGGLADVTLARVPGHGPVKQYVFAEQRPDFILLHSFWGRKTTVNRVQAFYDDYLPVHTSSSPDPILGHLAVDSGLVIRKDLVVYPRLSSTLARFGPVVLADVRGPVVGIQGSNLPLDLFWLVEAPQVQELSLRSRLVDTKERVIRQETQPLGYSWYPVTNWLPQEIVRQHMTVPLDVSDGPYRLELEIVDDAGRSYGPGSYDLPIKVGEAEALDYVSSQQEKSEQLLDEGQYEADLEALEWALAAKPDSQDTLRLIDRHREQALERLLADAEGALAAKDWDSLVQITTRAANLRIREDANRDWIGLSDRLYEAAQARVRDNDWVTAYQLYRAAVEADPQNAWAIRRLDEARTRVFGDG